MICQCCENEMSLVDGDWFCDNCETLYVPYDSTLLISQYGEDYKNEYLRRENLEENGVLQDIRWGFVQKFISGGSVLDMGCGVGAFLKQSPPAFSACGVEVNLTEIDHCRQQGLNVSAEIPRCKFDAITFWDVLEHFPDMTILNDLKSHMFSHTHVFITVPNFGKTLLEQVKTWKHYKPNEHIFCFSPHSIRCLCEKFGYEFVSQNFDESRVRGDYSSIATYAIRPIRLD